MKERIIVVRILYAFNHIGLQLKKYQFLGARYNVGQLITLMTCLHMSWKVHLIPNTRPLRFSGFFDFRVRIDGEM